jgi:hypothetical protein
MDYNPVFSPRTSAPSSPTSVATDAPRLVSAATADAILIVNIRLHVCVVELSDSNYNDWQMFFDPALSKFGLDAFVSSSTPVIDCDADWYKIDNCIVNWIYTTCSTDVLRIVRTSKKETDAFSLWTGIHNLYHDNQMQHTIFYEAEFHNMYQRDLSITDYCAKLKALTDSLHDVGPSPNQARY